MKYGDLVINHWAGNLNPNKILMVLSVGKQIRLISNKGRICSQANDKDLQLEVIGKVDFS